MNTNQSISLMSKKQKGATLFTALVFLALMTIVSVSAAKIASLDAVIAGNNQQQMLAYQQTDRTLTGFANPVRVVSAIADHHGVNLDWTKSIPHDSKTIYATREIKNRGVDYPCKATGLATSVGNDTAATCYVFDLFAEDKLSIYGVSDKHFRGVGKALPNTSNYQ